jgi:hypothetical protein
VEMPTHPAGLDPIVAEIIEALAGIIARKDNNKRGRSRDTSTMAKFDVARPDPCRRAVTRARTGMKSSSSNFTSRPGLCRHCRGFHRAGRANTRDVRPVTIALGAATHLRLGLRTCQLIAIIGVIVLISWPIMMSDFALTRAC